MHKKSSNFLESISFALSGIIHAYRTQRNMRIHSFFVLVVLFFALLLSLTRIEMAILILTMLMVLTLEMVNTALEAVVDMVTEEYLPLAKIAKDVAAGAVFLASLGAVLIGILIFGPNICQLFK
ncbi:diacylglycerol kinase family protein [Dehalobacterium formicoaceticum]|uniref:Diacylglycerol kinase family protein n=1 Tax=Dehalobacterium formicoaceticum TaxID=51515 RepID=A0ABT1Y1G3_9FIRM|nr:diacylglycerol kinase family protein [Dehalobacterium formicoaceticum]MCR6544030.1 diacylglycerol kinase family protein [Dehalobacterium formicoaceticum]